MSKSKKPTRSPKGTKATKRKPAAATAAKRTTVVTEASAAATAANVSNDQIVEAVENGNLTEGLTVPSTSNPKKAVEPKPKKPSGLDAAYEVLKANGEPMTCKAIVDEMLTKGLWSTNGRTPAATIYSAMLREIDSKPGTSRFTKTGRGLFALATHKS